MTGFEGIGRVLIVIGIFLILLGLLLAFWQKVPLLGKLPGDILVQKGNFRFFFPLVTSVIISLLLTMVLNIVFRLFK